MGVQKKEIQPLLFPLPERPEPEIRFEQSEHPVWTENKAKLIERYLYLFVLLTKHGSYIDGFAGPQRPMNPEMWSAKLVLESKPEWLRNIFLFDISRSKVQLLCDLRKSQSEVPDRKIRIFHGDFNTRIRELLRHNEISHNEATFCLIDQWTFQCHWSTLVKLARYKADGKPKIELFYFLAVRWLRRAIAALQDEAVLRHWWGRDDLIRLRGLNADQIKSEFVNRFRTELGYKSALAWPIYKRLGSKLIVYYMIHATDHSEAPKLMSRAYNNAVRPQGAQLSLPGMADLRFGACQRVLDRSSRNLVTFLCDWLPRGTLRSLGRHSALRSLPGEGLPRSLFLFLVLIPGFSQKNFALGSSRGDPNAGARPVAPRFLGTGSSFELHFMEPAC